VANCARVDALFNMTDVHLLEVSRYDRVGAWSRLLKLTLNPPPLHRAATAAQVREPGQSSMPCGHGVGSPGLGKWTPMSTRDRHTSGPSCSRTQRSSMR
jgi:hypothetical protein